jgi:hypothetical protein
MGVIQSSVGRILINHAITRNLALVLVHACWVRLMCCNHFLELRVAQVLNHRGSTRRRFLSQAHQGETDAQGLGPLIISAQALTIAVKILQREIGLEIQELDPHRDREIKLRAEMLE